MSSKKEIVVVGSCNMDIVIDVPHIPLAGETILAGGVRNFCGGKGANQAAAIARIGGGVALVGCVGDDDYGHDMLRQLSDYGVDVSAVEALEGQRSGNAYIYVSDSGENNIVVTPGANSCVSSEYMRRHLDLLNDADYCVIQLEIPLETLYSVAEICRQKGIKLVLNPAPAAKLDFSLLGGGFIIAPNETELDLLVEGGGSISEKANVLYSYGFENVLVTLGDKGCLLLDSSGERSFPVYTGLAVQDTTAAGDSFIGALVTRLSKGDDMDSAIKTATVAAAITVSRSGAQISLPTWPEVEQVLNGI